MRKQLLTELTGRVPSLDGLRAISILMVIASHARASCGVQDPQWLPRWVWWLFEGGLGVRIFFVISGFIITLLLLKEEESSGRISLGQFYKRRAIRILPPYLSLILVVFLMYYLIPLNFSRNIFVAALTFTTGWWKDSTWLLGHSWSLSVEEQFYLLWPLTLLVVKEKRARFRLLVIAFLMFPLMRIGVYKSPLVDQKSFLIVTTGDALLAGCTLAMLLFYEGERIKRWMTTAAVPTSLICLVLIFAVQGLEANAKGGLFTVPFANSIYSFAIAWMVGTVILNRGVVYTVLNSKPFVFVGVVSYSWYLWQQIFLVPCGRYDNWSGLTFPANLVLSFAAGVASYYLIERTSQRLRHA